MAQVDAVYIVECKDTQIDRHQTIHLLSSFLNSYSTGFSTVFIGTAIRSYLFSLFEQLQDRLQQCYPHLLLRTLIAPYLPYCAL
jgi:hypothetical protein